MDAPSPQRDHPDGRVSLHELLQALRGIWEMDGQKTVLEVDQEAGELLACTYQGGKVDPRPIITRGIQVQAFERHPLRNQERLVNQPGGNGWCPSCIRQEGHG